MKILILATLLLFPVIVAPACAELGNFCAEREYAEIQDMNKSELLKAFEEDASKVMDLMGTDVNHVQWNKCKRNIDNYKRQLKKRFKYKDDKLAYMDLQFTTGMYKEKK